jgi:hypothetical protein
MHGFPDVKVLKPLIGAELMQVCVGVNEVIFHFYPETTNIMVNAIDSFYENNSHVVTSAKKGLWFNNILESKIVDIIIYDKYRAGFVFSNGVKLTIIDDSKQYESVIFNFNGGTVVV